jgi:A/G-specific adenine glycosylase
MTDLRAFRRRLLQWFRRHRRDLPWRRTKDSYRIWISEVMLQQTRVAAVIPYYHKFLARFSTVRALARAGEAEVMKYWAGLGYYSRARLLHRAAKGIVARHAGRFPRDPDAAIKLPGVGRYTAAAVLSIAYDVPLAVLDGNVARVLARLGAVRGDLRAPERWRSLEARAADLLEARAPGDWNQAMMELGATVCTPRAPRCGDCPVARGCRAFAQGLTALIPEKRGKRATVRVRIAAAVMLDPAGHTILVRRMQGNSNEIFSRLWQFPAVEVVRSPRAELRRQIEEQFHLQRAEVSALPPARHTVTYREITLLPFLVRVARLPRVARRGLLPAGHGVIQRPLLADVETVPTSSATRKIARSALRHEVRESSRA